MGGVDLEGSQRGVIGHREGSWQVKGHKGVIGHGVIGYLEITRRGKIWGCGEQP